MMGVTVFPFCADDLFSIEPHEFHLDDEVMLNTNYAHDIERAGNCFTAKGDDGRVLMIGGIVVQHDGYATAWSIFSNVRGRNLLDVSKRVEQYFNGLDYPRVDTIVRKSFYMAQRFAERIGFEPEAILSNYFKNGDDAIIYRLKGIM